MILKFDDFIKLNEASNSTVVRLGELIKTLEPLGWKFKHSTRGDNMKISKGKYVNNGHLAHGNRADSSRLIDMAELNRFRKMFIDEFLETGDLTTIKTIDWNRWRLANPLDRELKEYNPETGEKIEKPVDEPELNVGQKLQKAKVDKAINSASELYKDAGLWKIDNNLENSAYIMSMYDEQYRRNKYNICRSLEDRRPLQKDWTFDYKEEDGKYYFGKDDMRALKTKYYKINADGTLDSKVAFVVESLKYKNMLKV